MNVRVIFYILGLAVVALFTWGIATSTRGGDTGDATPATASEVLAIVGVETGDLLTIEAHGAGLRSQLGLAADAAVAQLQRIVRTGRRTTRDDRRLLTKVAREAVSAEARTRGDRTRPFA